MSGFPPPLNNLPKSPTSDDSASEKKTINANHQTGSSQQTGQTNQKSWATGSAQKSPRIQSKPSTNNLKLPQSDPTTLSASNQRHTHTQPLTSPRIGARGLQQSDSTTGSLSPTPTPANHQDAGALTAALLNSASPVHVRASSTNATTTTTTTTTTNTTSNPVNTTTINTTTRQTDSVNGSGATQSEYKASTQERRLKKTEKKTGLSTDAGAAINGADLSPERMAKFLIKAATQGGKLQATPNNVKTFMRENFGKIDGKSAQTCFGEFLEPVLESSRIGQFYREMAYDLLVIFKEKDGVETSLVEKLDELCKREGMDPTKYTDDTAIQKLIDPVITPLFDYLNDIDGSIANSKLPAKLLEFMIHFDREVVKWYRKTSGKQSVTTADDKSKSANSIGASDEEDLNTFRRNAQIALLGVKGIDGHLGMEVFKRLLDLGFHSSDSTGGILKNFNSYLGKVYSKKCDVLINKVLAATDDDLKEIKGRRVEEEKNQLIERAEKNFAKASNKSNTKQPESDDNESDSQEEVIANTAKKISPRSDAGVVSGSGVLSGKQLHQIEEKNEEILESFFDKYPDLEKFDAIISKILKTVEVKYTKSGKSPSDKELQQIAVDAIGEEIKLVEDKIKISQTQTAHVAQAALKTELRALMGQILLETQYNPFDQ